MTPYLWCQLGGWSAYTLFYVLYYGSWKGWTPGVIITHSWWGLLGIIFTHLLRGHIRRRRWLQLPIRQLALRVVGAALLLGAALGTLREMVAIFVFSAYSPREMMFTHALAILTNNTVIVLLWILLYFGVHYFRGYREAEIRALRLEAAAQEAQYRALRSQVNPHFLFNCLNSLRALIVEDPARAQSAVTRLSGILRYALQSDRAETVSLESEMEVVEDYLALEPVRLEERLRLSVDVQPEAQAARVPATLVQTLVENALKHGIARLPEGGDLSIRAQAASNRLQIEVVNTGQLRPAAASTGVGLRNARERLRHLYGDSATLTVENRDGYSVVSLSVPLDTAKDTV